ncbi:hypothetical protein NUU61_004900 [Penicillium alfredii]|uniref:Protein kinase domain-containing protein n=1 Tax=Penicillium alfredii TaxID=1506179 RepID=A0A9W9F8H8_9EURO|nr:uncharacterized protein NUU61_004900 [Penicillium alfredii]KAJ5095544.1 hypothetical protein NUU61_004900 [Penicillium alfredii]
MQFNGWLYWCIIIAIWLFCVECAPSLHPANSFSPVSLSLKPQRAERASSDFQRRAGPSDSNVRPQSAQLIVSSPFQLRFSHYTVTEDRVVAGRTDPIKVYRAKLQDLEDPRQRPETVAMKNSHEEDLIRGGLIQAELARHIKYIMPVKAILVVQGRDISKPNWLMLPFRSPKTEFRRMILSNQINDKLRVVAIAQLSEGLKLLHAEGYYHGNIRARNAMLWIDELGYMTMQWIDFDTVGTAATATDRLGISGYGSPGTHVLLILNYSNSNKSRTEWFYLKRIEHQNIRYSTHASDVFSLAMLALRAIYLYQLSYDDFVDEWKDIIQLHDPESIVRYLTWLERQGDLQREMTEGMRNVFARSLCLERYQRFTAAEFSDHFSWEMRSVIGNTMEC